MLLDEARKVRAERETSAPPRSFGEGRKSEDQVGLGYDTAKPHVVCGICAIIPGILQKIGLLRENLPTAVAAAPRYLRAARRRSHTSPLTEGSRP
jgi:hypothetical protein